MKPQLSEKLFVESLVNSSVSNGSISPIGMFGIEALTGDASTRRYYRVRGHEDQSFVVCLDNPSEDNIFVETQKVLEENGVRVPHIHDLKPRKGYILQEDLGNLTLLKYLAGISKESEELELYKKIIDELVQIHSIDPMQYEGRGFTQQFFDHEKLIEEMNFTKKHFLENYLGIDRNDSRVMTIDSQLEELCKIIATRPKVITHRDFHSRNIMVKDGELAIIDFQDMRMGLRQYDLASLLEDAYYQVASSHREYLLEYYFKQTGSEESLSQFKSDYLMTAVQRVYKAIGSFTYIYGQRGDIRYLKYIGFCFEKLRRILVHMDHFDSLRKCLSEIYYDH